MFLPYNKKKFVSLIIGTIHSSFSAPVSVIFFLLFIIHTKMSSLSILTTFAVSEPYDSLTIFDWIVFTQSANIICLYYMKLCPVNEEIFLAILKF